MKRKPLYFVLLITGFILFISCETDDTEPQKKGYTKGVFISCEGAFRANNGSVSWYDTDSSKITNNLFNIVNGRPAGDVIQSFALAGNKGVIVANNSGKIEIVDLETFKSTGTIIELSYPRYFVYADNGRGYISNGNLHGEVYEVDLISSTITDTISVGMGPEQMLILNNQLYVANSGGWDYDNTISVINTNTNELVETIPVGDIPLALVADLNDDIWVLCMGQVVYNEAWTEIIEETDSKLIRINTRSLSVTKEVVLGQKGDYFNPSYLAVSMYGDTLYFEEKDGLYAMSINDDIQPVDPVIRKNFSSVKIHPKSGKIFATEITDYSSPGFLHIYKSYSLVRSLDTGIAPGGIVFAD